MLTSGSLSRFYILREKLHFRVTAR